MSRPKGTPKTGGRVKGTPNKVTSSLKEWISSLIDENREQIENDLKSLEPKERLQILSRFLEYIIPKAKTESEEEISTEECTSLIRQSIINLNKFNDKQKNKTKETA